MKSRTLGLVRLTQRACKLDPHRCCKRHTATGRIPVLPHGPDCRIPHKRPRDQRAMHPNLLSGDTQEEEEKAICSNGFPGLDPGRPLDSGALVNCISEREYNKIFQMYPKVIVKKLEAPLQTPIRERRYWNPHKDDNPPSRDRGLEL